jgi:hypothetical protein
MNENTDETEHEETNETVPPRRLKKCCANCRHYGDVPEEVPVLLEEITCPVCGQSVGLNVPSCPHCGAEFEEVKEGSELYRCLRTRFPDLSPDLETYNARLKQDKKTFKKTGKHTMVKRDFCEKFAMVLPLTPEELLEEKVVDLKREIEADLARAKTDEVKTVLEMEYQRLLRVRAGEEPYEKPVEKVPVAKVKPSVPRNIIRRGEGFACSMCDYTSLSREAAKKHFKRKHRETKISPIPPGESPQPDRKIEGGDPWGGV